MRQSSEAFAKVMLENEDNGNSQNFVEKMAEFEKSMTERIDKMQNDLLSKMAEVQTANPDLKEVKTLDDPESNPDDPEGNPDDNPDDNPDNE